VAGDAGADAIAFHQDDRPSSARQLQRGGDAGDPAADNARVRLEVGRQRWRA
jgi:hypothetical protein